MTAPPLRIVARRLEIWVAGPPPPLHIHKGRPGVVSLSDLAREPRLGGEISQSLLGSGTSSQAAVPGELCQDPCGPLALLRILVPVLCSSVLVCHLQVSFSPMSTPSNASPALISLGNPGRRPKPPFPRRSGGQAQLSFQSAGAPGPLTVIWQVANFRLCRRVPRTGSLRDPGAAPAEVGNLQAAAGRAWL